MVAITAPLQILAGDMDGLNALDHQPAKIMAIEGHFQSHPHGAPLILFGLPDRPAARVRAEIAIPKASSLILKHDQNAPLAGLDTIPRENWPVVPVVFWSFRMMVGLGLLMLALGGVGFIARLRRKLYAWRILHWFAVTMRPAGFVAVLAGWVTAEAGRQPFTVYGLLRTAHSAAPLDAPAVGTSLLAFICVYFVVFGAGGTYILRLMSHPPHAAEPSLEEATEGPIRAAGITPAPAIHPYLPIAPGKERA
jgi:cytochrome d ubiquinol oxidase subunit I